MDELIEAKRVVFLGDSDPNVQAGYELTANGQRIVLSHYAQCTWKDSFRGAWHLYGHSHGNLPPFRKSFDVGVDAHDFRPISLDKVRQRMDVVEEPFSDTG